MKAQGVLVAVVIGCLAGGCSEFGPEDELPEVLSPLPWETCPVVRAGRAVSEGGTYFLDGGGLTDCARTEFDACGKGRVAYRLRIGSQGDLLALEFEEPHIPAVEACVARRLRAALFTPAVDCNFSPVAYEFRGAVAWNPDVGISEAVPGLAGIVPALPECALPGGPHNNKMNLTKRDASL